LICFKRLKIAFDQLGKVVERLNQLNCIVNNIRLKEEEDYHSIIDFYPFYKSQHQGLVTRVLHFIGTGLVLLFLLLFALTLELKYLGFAPLAGYGFAWVGHFFIEKNKPATFRYPAYSLACDFWLFWDLLRGKESFENS